MEPKAIDFIKSYTPLGSAKLVEYDEDKVGKWTLSWFRGHIRKLFRWHDEEVTPTINDRLAEQGWESIKQSGETVSVSSLTSYCERRFRSSDHLRIQEYPFMVRQILGRDLGHGLVVDVGGGNSYSTVILIMMQLTGASIVSLDVVNSGLASGYGVEYRHGDCMATGLPDASVDLVTCISTLEHVGLGRWGDPLDVNGDIQAMREIYRILKAGGHLILTVPFGEPTVVYNLHRVYDEGRISLLSAGFERVVEEYSLLGNLAEPEDVRGRPVVTRFDTFYNHDPYPLGAPNPQAGIMLLLRKPVDTP